ncbi:MAG: ribbon-helix-helix protein, CopG family [Candidatus Promineofilum sp.]|nr:ribbon-helix-helix protein, CopG family [Promineifilum sp.]
MTQLYRTQVLLEQTQHDSLRELATAEGRSVSEVVREAVAEYLVERNREVQKQYTLTVLAELAEIREAIRRESGEFPEELILNDRAEREEELWQRMGGSE